MRQARISSRLLQPDLPVFFNLEICYKNPQELICSLTTIKLLDDFEFRTSKFESRINAHSRSVRRTPSKAIIKKEVFDVDQNAGCSKDSLAQVKGSGQSERCLAVGSIGPN